MSLGNSVKYLIKQLGTTAELRRIEVELDAFGDENESYTKEEIDLVFYDRSMNDFEDRLGSLDQRKTAALVDKSIEVDTGDRLIVDGDSFEITRIEEYRFRGKVAKKLSLKVIGDA